MKSLALRNAKIVITIDANNNWKCFLSVQWNQIVSSSDVSRGREGVGGGNDIGWREGNYNFAIQKEFVDVFFAPLCLIRLWKY